MSSVPSLPAMPQEIVLLIFGFLPDVQSVLNLAAASKQFRDAFKLPEQKQSINHLRILYAAIERQFDPMKELYQLVNFTAAQSVENLSSKAPELSMELIKNLTSFGMCAEQWSDLYPQIRWSSIDHASFRRELRAHERQRLRQAIYRWWIYCKSFHTTTFLSSPMGSDIPMAGDENDPRNCYMKRFDIDGAIEMCEVVDIIRDHLEKEICPDNATIQTRFREIFPDSPPLYFGSYETHPRQQQSTNSNRDIRDAMVSQSWGCTAYRSALVDDVMKLDPHQLLDFCTKLNIKRERKAFLIRLGPSFRRNPGTMRDAVDSFLADLDDGSMALGQDHGVDGGIIDDLEEEDEDVAEDDGADHENMEGSDDESEDHHPTVDKEVLTTYANGLGDSDDEEDSDLDLVPESDDEDDFD